MSQADLAHAAGVGRRFVSEVEKGKATVRFEELQRLCKASGLELRVALTFDAMYGKYQRPQD